MLKIEKILENKNLTRTFRSRNGCQFCRKAKNRLEFLNDSSIICNLINRSRY